MITNIKRQSFIDHCLAALGSGGVEVVRAVRMVRRSGGAEVERREHVALGAEVNDDAGARRGELDDAVCQLALEAQQVGLADQCRECCGLQEVGHRNFVTLIRL